jgi:DNA-binding transcriptional regulator YiaG
MTNHEKFKQMKSDLKLNNSDIANIIGTSEQNVKNQTGKSKELATWAKSMIYVWERLKPLQ